MATNETLCPETVVALPGPLSAEQCDVRTSESTSKSIQSYLPLLPCHLLLPEDLKESTCVTAVQEREIASENEWDVFATNKRREPARPRFHRAFAGLQRLAARE